METSSLLLVKIYVGFTTWKWIPPKRELDQHDLVKPHKFYTKIELLALLDGEWVKKMQNNITQ